MGVLERLRRSPVLILGCGVNHRALIPYLAANGVAVTVRDPDPSLEGPMRGTLPAGGGPVRWEGLGLTDGYDGYGVIIRTPGLPLRTPALTAAAAAGTEVTSQTQLFLELCPAETIGVTGTKGKGTCSSLIAAMFERGYSEGRTYLAGNIGSDPFSFLDALHEGDVVVLELSSFQCDGLTLSPHVAVMLRTSQDHLDHHGSVREYLSAKGNLLDHQRPNDLAVINDELPSGCAWAAGAPGRVVRVSRSAPRREAAWCADLEGGEACFVQAEGQLHSYSVEGRQLLGAHNKENVAAACAVAARYRLPAADVEHAVRNFRGLPHRLQPVGGFDGADAFDDSFATTPESAVVALEALAGRRIHLVAGGRNKGQEHGELAAAAVRACTTVSLLPGPASGALLKALRRAAKGTACIVLPPPERGPLFSMLFSGIRPHLRPGDAVLLSPGAASAPPFADYKQRGDEFAAAVRQASEGRAA